VLKPNLIRLAIIILSGIGVVVALVPMLVLVDLAAGGTGFGVCPDGIENCPRPYSAGAEMIIALTIVLFAVILGIRVLMKIARRVQTGSTKEPVAAIEAESSLPADE
jgi:succinate dehydrogenase/fumarate reductase cytochrome b subunit